MAAASRPEPLPAAPAPAPAPAAAPATAAPAPVTGQLTSPKGKEVRSLFSCWVLHLVIVPSFLMVMIIYFNIPIKFCHISAQRCELCHFNSACFTVDKVCRVSDEQYLVSWNKAGQLRFPQVGCRAGKSLGRRSRLVVCIIGLSIRWHPHFYRALECWVIPRLVQVCAARKC